MIGRTIERLLNGAYPDPDGGPPLRVPTKSVVIAQTLEGSEAALVRALDFGRHLDLFDTRRDDGAYGLVGVGQDLGVLDHEIAYMKRLPDL